MLPPALTRRCAAFTQRISARLTQPRFGMLHYCANTRPVVCGGDAVVYARHGGTKTGRLYRHFHFLFHRCLFFGLCQWLIMHRTARTAKRNTQSPLAPDGII